MCMGVCDGVCVCENTGVSKAVHELCMFDVMLV